ncbi:MAG: UvrB/uvrC motif protein [Verrucomicrobiales bacterium]|nr:UvrB/uvrC motif protein [Verrucomicrobiales bacterium]
MNFDISHLLEHWSYEPGQVVVRRFKGKDGEDKIQLRVDLGILQMNAEGRPDGKRPFGHESLFEHHQTQLEKYRATHDGDDEGFKLYAEDIGKLQQEGIQYHHRYICLFQIEDFAGVVRDTSRNLQVFDFVAKYADSNDIAWSLQQFRPQLLMMRVRAKGALALKSDDYPKAIDLISHAIDEIREFYNQHSRQDLADHSGEIQSLEVWLQEVETKRPLSEMEKLQHELEEAVQTENYEKAAKVRDAMKKIKT